MLGSGECNQLFWKDSWQKKTKHFKVCLSLLHRSGHHLTTWRAWERSSWPPERPWPARPWSQILSWASPSHLWSGAVRCFLPLACGNLTSVNPKAALEAVAVCFWTYVVWCFSAYLESWRVNLTVALLSAASNSHSDIHMSASSSETIILSVLPFHKLQLLKFKWT